MTILRLGKRQAERAGIFCAQCFEKGGSVSPIDYTKKAIIDPGNLIFGSADTSLGEEIAINHDKHHPKHSILLWKFDVANPLTRGAVHQLKLHRVPSKNNYDFSR